MKGGMNFFKNGYNRGMGWELFNVCYDIVDKGVNPLIL